MTLLARFRASGMLRRAVAHLAVLGLVLQLGVAAAHDTGGLGAFASVLHPPLCHAAGGAAPHQPSAPGKADSCPFCLALDAVAALVPPSPQGATTLAAVLPVPLPAPASVARHAHDPGSPAQPRAPPTFA